MTLSELAAANGGQAGLARRLGCSKSYLNHVLSGRKALGPRLAIRIFEATGEKLGPLEGASTRDIKALQRIEARAA